MKVLLQTARWVLMAAGLVATSACAFEALLTDDTSLALRTGASNLGASPLLRVDGGYNALFKFDLGMLPSGTTAADVSVATLTVFINRVSKPGAIRLFRVQGAWSEQAVPVVTLMSLPDSAVAVIPANAKNSFVCFEVTSLVKSWISGTANDGVAIGVDTSGPDVSLGLDSKENTSGGHCAALRIELTANRAGGQAAQGPQGAAGPQGPQGPPGSQGPPGPNRVSGTYSDLVAFGNGGNSFNGLFIGNGAGITNLNGANLRPGTVGSNALDSATKALLGSGGPLGGTFDITNLTAGTVPVDNTNQVWASAFADAGINGVFWWNPSIQVYTNGPGYGLFADVNNADFGTITNAGGDVLATSGGVASAEWYDAVGNGPIDGATGFGTNIVTAYVFARNGDRLTALRGLNVAGAGVSNNAAAFTNMPGSGLVSYSLGPNKLDNATWLSVLAGNFSAYSNVNRFAWTNTARQMRANGLVTVLYEGTGLIGAGLLDQVGNRLQQLRPWAGWIYQFGGYFYPNPYPSTGAIWVGRDTNWYGNYAVTTNTGGIVEFLGVTPSRTRITANVFEIDYICDPTGGSFKVQTNAAGGGYHDHETYTAVNSYSPVTVGKVLRWTNTTPAQVGVRIVSSAGTNKICGGAIINTTVSNGVVLGMITQSSSTLGQIQAASTAVRIPIYQSWNPCLVLFNDINQTATYALNITNYCGFYRSNMPNTDLVLCGTYPVAPIGNNETENIGTEPMMIQAAWQFGYAYFDGHTPFGSWDNLNSRGWMHDGTHMFTYHYEIYGDLLWCWLALADHTR